MDNVDEDNQNAFRGSADSYTGGLSHYPSLIHILWLIFADAHFTTVYKSIQFVLFRH